jgi:hypothetical protein
MLSTLATPSSIADAAIGRSRTRFPTPTSTFRDRRWTRVTITPVKHRDSEGQCDQDNVRSRRIENDAPAERTASS